jgi:hypothetical protein
MLSQPEDIFQREQLISVVGREVREKIQKGSQAAPWLFPPAGQCPQLLLSPGLPLYHFDLNWATHLCISSWKTRVFIPSFLLLLLVCDG